MVYVYQTFVNKNFLKSVILIRFYLSDNCAKRKTQLKVCVCLTCNILTIWNSSTFQDEKWIPWLSRYPQKFKHFSRSVRALYKEMSKLTVRAEMTVLLTFKYTLSFFLINMNNSLAIWSTKIIWYLMLNRVLTWPRHEWVSE